MKKWIVIGLLLLMISGCSWQKVYKWINEMEFEREDETIRSFIPFIR
jgi:hypothetical protein